MEKWKKNIPSYFTNKFIFFLHDYYKSMKLWGQTVAKETRKEWVRNYLVRKSFRIKKSRKWDYKRTNLKRIGLIKP